MIARKERLTITVDAHLVEAGNLAVASGRADSLSGWVNLALAERIDKERRLAAMAEAVAAYEKRFGEITSDEIAGQTARGSAGGNRRQGTPADEEGIA